METKLHVYGRSNVRTALGIVTAYIMLFEKEEKRKPTLAELRKVFPDKLNTARDSASIFLNSRRQEKEKDTKFKNYIETELTTDGGERIALVRLWNGSSLNRLIEVARKNCIETTFMGKAIRKGWFRIVDVYGNPIPGVLGAVSIAEAEAEERKERMIRWFLWLLLLLLLLGIVCFLFCTKCEHTPRTSEEVVETRVESVIAPEAEKVPAVEAPKEIKKDFRAAQFEQGKAELSEDAKLELRELAGVLETNPELKLQIVGHASSEGSDEFNQKLSVRRAKVAADFLMECGIAAERIQYEGRGSREPIDPNTLEVNRRTEYTVLE